MNMSYSNDPLLTQITPQISGYSTLGNIGKYTFQINYTTAINISLLFPPSTNGVNSFIFIESYIDGMGNVDYCNIGINNVTASTILI